jgi:hypothetical protein
MSRPVSKKKPLFDAGARKGDGESEHIEYDDDTDDDDTDDDEEENDIVMIVDEDSPREVKSEPKPKAIIHTDMTKIDDKVFIGNWAASTNQEKLKINQIDKIICISSTEKFGYVLDAYQNSKIDHHQFKLDDTKGAPIEQIFEPCYEIIHSAKKVLIHCNSGESLSAAIAAMWLMRNNKISFEDAEKRISAKREISILPQFSRKLYQAKFKN